MTDPRSPGPGHPHGTRALIIGVALTITGLVSEAALVVQLAAYEPSCEPIAAWAFTGACGALRLLVLLMLPFLLTGLLLIGGGLALRRASRSREAGSP